MIQIEKIIRNETFFVSYKGVKYPYIKVVAILDGDKENTYQVNVGVSSLGDKLIDQETGEGFNAECRLIDNSFYCYVDDDKLTLPDDRLAEYISNNFD